MVREPPNSPFDLFSDPREGSLQQRVLLCVRSGLGESLLLLLVGVLQCHCVMLWTVSTFINEGVHHGLLSLRGYLLVRHCWAYRSSCLFLSSGFLSWNLCLSCHCHTLPFTCAHDFLSSHLLRNVMHCGRLRLRVLFLTLRRARLSAG